MINIYDHFDYVADQAFSLIKSLSIKPLALARFKFKSNPINVDGANEESLTKMANDAFKAVNLNASVSSVMHGPVISRIFAKLDNISRDQLSIVKSPITADTFRMIFGQDKLTLDLDPNSQSIVIDVPNKVRALVPFGNIFDTLKDSSATIPVALGCDITGKPVSIDLADAPHMLIAGQTGAGKSVCINSIIMSIIARLNPNFFKLTLVDPKAVELKMYEDAEHLAQPIITDPAQAIEALKLMCHEMDLRKDILAKAKVRNIATFNQKVRNSEDLDIDPLFYCPMPYHIIVIDEFADLMLTAEKELVTYVSRIAAVGRALGIHIILATQRPAVKVIPGEIKANIPTRIAFKVADEVNSNVILDERGAEKLLGKGDMILKFKGLDSQRVHGCFISDEEVEQVQYEELRNMTDCIPFNFAYPKYDITLKDELSRIQLYVAAKATMMRLLKNGYSLRKIIEMNHDELAGILHTKDVELVNLFKKVAEMLHKTMQDKLLRKNGK